MGNFSGHFFSGTAVFLLAIWWMYHGFKRYIKSRMGHGKYEAIYSYTTKICGREIPLEQILKVIFSSLLLMGEVFISKFRYWDEQGELKGIPSIMHLSYYLIFFVHCVVDLCMKGGVKGFPDNMDFFTGSLAFFWNALSLYYHVQMKGKEGVEYGIHVMPTYFINLTAISLLLMPFLKTYYLLDLMRSYGLIIMGTWFVNAAFILYKPGMEQGSPPSNWDLHRKQNVNFIYALLGFHISLAVVIVVIVYQITYRLTLREIGQSRSYHKLDNNNRAESICLMVDAE